MRDAARCAGRAQLRDPRRSWPAARRRRAARAAAAASACRHREQSGCRRALAAAAPREPVRSRHRMRVDPRSGRRDAQVVGDAPRPADAAPRGPRRALDDARGAWGRRRRRPHRFCRGHLPARDAVRAGADHAAGAGGLLGRRQDRRQSSAGQEHDRGVSPAACRADRHGLPLDACRIASLRLGSRK